MDRKLIEVKIINKEGVVVINRIKHQPRVYVRSPHEPDGTS